MKYLLITAVLVAFTLTACGDPKPAQHPPSLYKDFEDPLTDEALAEVKRKSAEKRAAEKIEDVTEEVEDSAEEVADAAEEEAEEVKEEIEEDDSY